MAPSPKPLTLTSRATEQHPQRERPSPEHEGKLERLISREVAIELVDHYVDKLHDRPHSLFHPATIRRKAREGSIPKILLLSICSMGSRFSSSQSIRSLETQLLGESKKLLLSDLENICLENVQSCILVANVCAAHLNPTSEALFFSKLPGRELEVSVTEDFVGIANGMAQILRLDCMDVEGTAIEREVRRRVWWTLVMADRWSSSGLGLRRQIDELTTTIDLPMDEAVFATFRNDDDKPAGSWSPGLWAHMITLVRLLGPIHDLNFKCAGGEMSEDDLQRETEAISRQLEGWEQLLPAKARLTEQNLEKHLAAGTAGAFVALHLGYYHYSTLLYFQFLEKERQAGTPVEIFVSKCKTHASAYSNLLQRSRQYIQCRALYPTVCHMAVVSSSVLVHTLLFGDESELATARQELNANFEAIVELQQYWPSSSTMVS